ncbi:hypothetical protein RRG08_054181 [Elysia crispata]|uniref:Uncharacterized protein n=1 Tax=Elysia crispata TaxID=231223 RepID=A0AAE1A2X3_9GAST|nr:hypothetical protein RRG08_054181 [Elysia crispata]
MRTRKRKKHTVQGPPCHSNTSKIDVSNGSGGRALEYLLPESSVLPSSGLSHTGGFHEYQLTSCNINKENDSAGSEGWNAEQGTAFNRRMTRRVRLPTTKLNENENPRKFLSPPDAFNEMRRLGAQNSSQTCLLSAPFSRKK